MIELRSDTFSLPTLAMRKAILAAQLGNDDYGEDPTVLELEMLTAKKLGKEAACLMPSGTMANLASILAHCRYSQNVVLVGERSDIYAYEAEGALLCRGLTYEPIPTETDGTLRISNLELAFGKVNERSDSQVSVVCLENPHNLNGGVILPCNYLKEAAAFIHSKGALLHLDGARIFNASVASGVPVAELVRYADSVQFCLSKGLAAPVGSLAVGGPDFISRVRALRKTLGGTMRQSGIIAAAGIVALNRMVERLAEDHANARRLANGLARMPGIVIDLSTVQTNSVVFQVTDRRFTRESFIAAVRERGVHLGELKFGMLRAVLHHGVTSDQIDDVLAILSATFSQEPTQTTHAAYVHN